MLFQWFKQRSLRRKQAQDLYKTALAQSRSPAFYADLGVADTMDGRFDMLSLHIVLIIDRLNMLGTQGVKLGQALFDAMFKRMDLDLREMGIGDLGVPKHMNKMMKAFNGRRQVYHDAFASGNQAAIELALSRNVFRMQGEAVPAGAPALALYTLQAHSALSAFDLAAFQSGKVSFPPVGNPSVSKAA